MEQISSYFSSPNLIVAGLIGACLVVSPAYFGPDHSGPYDRSRKRVNKFHATSRLVLVFGLFMITFGLFPGVSVPYQIEPVDTDTVLNEVNQTLETQSVPVAEILSEETIQVATTIYNI